MNREGREQLQTFLLAVASLVVVIQDSGSGTQPEVATQFFKSHPNNIDIEQHGNSILSGHGGEDLFTNYNFANAIRTGEPPYHDVYHGVAMSIVGIQAYRSALDDGNSVDVPDLRKNSMRAKYRKDHWTADPARRKSGDPWPSVNSTPS